jgi:DtxR family transcriptional regulator, Mn-dependent transcriptional regulator
MTPLIDATEMYLRTVWELEEEGITPIRARLVERLNLSAPAVSETVTRLDEEGLMRIGPDRTLRLTDKGREVAISVMRKHRLAELLLTDVIGMDWEHVHNEACRWEHVISDAAESRIASVLGDPATCPYGNPIPGAPDPLEPEALRSLGEAGRSDGMATVQRISEKLQSDVDALRFLRTHGLRPGASVVVTRRGSQVRTRVVDPHGDGERAAATEGVVTPPEVADLVYVTLDGG